MQELSKMNGVMNVEADMCMFGLTTPGKKRSEFKPAKKPTRLRTNSWHIAQTPQKRCDGSHQNARLEEGKPKAAAIYP